PARASIDTVSSGVVNPAGPHQEANCSGVVHASNTFSRGTSNCRVMVMTPGLTGASAVFVMVVSSLESPGFAAPVTTRITARRHDERAGPVPAVAAKGRVRGRSAGAGGTRVGGGGDTGRVRAGHRGTGRPAVRQPGPGHEPPLRRYARPRAPGGLHRAGRGRRERGGRRRPADRGTQRRA